MDLLIKGFIQAFQHQPTNPTYVIRINSEVFPLEKKHGHRDHPLYTPKEYTFDDRTPNLGSGRLFTPDIAERILTDFRTDGLDKEALLVYCIRGKNRSPAVGMALNEIFALGHDPEELGRQFPETNWYIYGTLLNVADKLMIARRSG
ncbi:MAG TPA: hypothetical protein VJA23_03035 [Candidatus Nanoarchaeia archaeon]|nr:hypothetical protein [Candidatus Nanoarchaeia archaeon]